MKYIRQLHKIKPSGWTRLFDNKSFEWVWNMGLVDTRKYKLT